MLYLIFVSHMHVSLQNVIVDIGTTRILKIIETKIYILYFLRKIILQTKLEFEKIIFNGFLTNIIY